LHTPDANLSKEAKVAYHASEIIDLLSLPSSGEKKGQEEEDTHNTIIKAKNLLDQFSKTIPSLSSSSNVNISTSVISKEAKALRTVAEQLKERAHRAAEQAKLAFEKLEYVSAISFYDEALQLAQQAQEHAQEAMTTYKSLAWRNVAQEIANLLQEKIQQWSGIKCQAVLKLAEKEKEEAIAQRELADQVERNEIGSTWDAIARKWDVIARHAKNATSFYEQGNVQEAKECERKAGIIKTRIQDLEIELQELKDKLEIWKRDFQTEASRYLETQEEIQSDGTKIVRSVYKPGYTADLVGSEKKIYPDGRVAVAEMAAEYLMLHLNSNEDKESTLTKLKEYFPNNNLRIEDVLTGRCYALHFQSSEEKPSRLNLWTEIKTTIEQHHLAAKCYADCVLNTISSSSADLADLKKK